MRDFRNLQVWDKAHSLTLNVYKATMSFPKEELYGLTSQIRRSSASIPTNIAEGCGRNGEAELARFISISMGSASELEYQLLLAHDLNYLDQDTYTNLHEKVIEVKRMLAGFFKTLKK
jgi:four helix bundle protein